MMTPNKYTTSLSGTLLLGRFQVWVFILQGWWRKDKSWIELWIPFVNLLMETKHTHTHKSKKKRKKIHTYIPLFSSNFPQKLHHYSINVNTSISDPQVEKTYEDGEPDCGFSLSFSSSFQLPPFHGSNHPVDKRDKLVK